MKHKINTATGTCSVCGLTTTTGFTRECLGKLMHPLTVRAVSKGEIDYYDGGFHSRGDMRDEIQNRIDELVKSAVAMHGIKVEIHAPRMQRANAEAGTRDDYVPSPNKLEAYETMEKFIKDFMAQESKPKQEEYSLSKDEIEFLKQIHEHPIPKRVIVDLDLTKDQFIMLHDFKKAGYIYVSVDGSNTWIVTPKAKAYLESLSKPAPLVMTKDGIALLTILMEEFVTNDEVADDEDMTLAADLLVGLELAIDCGEHLHITPKGRAHIKNLLEMKID